MMDLRKRLGWLATVAFLLAASTAGATSKGLDEPIDLKVKKAQAADVLRTFGEILEVEVEIEDNLSGELTLNLEAKPVRAVLDAICRQLGCRWHIEEGAQRRLVFSAKK